MKIQYIGLWLKQVSPEKSDGSVTYKGGETANGHTDGVGTQNNRIDLYVTLNGEIRSTDDVINNALHELGHTGGLDHPWEENCVDDIKQPVDVSNLTPEGKKKLKSNLMNSDANPKRRLANTKGSDLTPGQMLEIKETVESQQPQKK